MAKYSLMVHHSIVNRWVINCNLVLCQTSKLGFPWQFHQVNQRVQYIFTLKSQFDGALDFSASTMAEVLNRLGFRLRKVVQAKPQKKIAETDAIVDNIAKRPSGDLGPRQT
jgi:hypothetical protein